MYATRRRFGSSRTCMALLAFVLGVSGCDSRVPVDPNPVQNPPAPPPTTFVLQGTVRGEEGINLAGAKVRLIDARAVSREVTTDANGAFFFTDVAGAVRLIVSHPDYFETFENVLVQGNRSVFIVMVNRVSAADQIVGRPDCDAQRSSAGVSERASTACRIGSSINTNSASSNRAE